MRRTFRSIAIFLGTYLFSVNAWSAFEVLVRGEYEPKLGGPWSNLLFGAGFSAILTIVVATGFCVLTFAGRSFLSRQLSQFGAVLAAAVAVVLTVSGAIGWFLATVGGELGSVVLWYFLVGLISAFAALLAGLVERSPNTALQTDR